jgi:protein-tyrosine phosphatase
MIDLHTHILPGVDDGVDTIEESLEMCRIAYRDGIRTIVATPHTLNGLYQNDRPSILAKVQELNTALIQFRNPKSAMPLSEFRNPNFEILPGADVHLNDQTISQLDGGKVTTIGDKGKCLLLEFPFTGIPYGAEEVLHQLISRGIIPIISHPERNFEVKQNPKRYSEMIRMGCLGQGTAMSLTDGFGPASKRLAEQLLSKGLIHIIASDAHSTDGRPPVLSHGVRAAAKIVGEKEALRMVTDHPQSILEGRRPDVREPKPPG